MIVLNVLANALPLGGRTTGEISDAYPNLFAPAGYTFAIWGLILPADRRPRALPTGHLPGTARRDG
jgi:hypothetical protein